MSDEIGTEIAPAQAVDVPVENQQSSEGSGQNGIQKRIDELTARFHEANARAEAMAQANAQLIAAQVQRQPQVAPVVDEAEAEMQKLEQYSPEVAQSIRKALAAVEARVSKQVGATQAVLRAQAASRDLEQLAQSKGIKDSRVTARAQALLQDWQAKGLQFNAADAMTFAAGEFSMNPQQPRQVDGKFAPLDSVVTAQGTPPVPRPKTSKPQNFESLPVDQQIQWFEASGLGDKEF